VRTALAGLLGEEELAAHCVTLSISTFTFLSFPFADRHRLHNQAGSMLRSSLRHAPIMI
jgi:hypothetical protein